MQGPSRTGLRILYVIEARLPTEKAHGIQVAKTCEALAETDAEVCLAFPRRYQVNPELKGKDLWEAYGLKRNFKAVGLPCIDLLWLEHWLQRPLFFAFPLLNLSFSLFVLPYALWSNVDVVYSRNFLSLIWLLPVSMISGVRLYYEVHDVPSNRLIHSVKCRLLKLTADVVVITDGLANLFEKAGFERERLLVAPDAVDLDEFHIEIPPDELRRELGLPMNKRIVCYTGNLYPWKGVHTLALCSRYLPNDVHVLIVGGSIGDHNISPFREFLEQEDLGNVTMTGHRPHATIPKYLAASDVLVLPNSSEATISREYTSPLKLFEYMASNTPLVASDLPSLREVLNEGNAELVEPDSPAALAKGIMKVLDEEGLGDRHAKQAFQDVHEFSWARRVKKILTFIGQA